MKRFSISLLLLLLAIVSCYGQGSTAAAAPGAPTPIGHGAFPVHLVKTLDSSKLKEGDAVEAETGGSFKLADGTLVPKGSKLIGHVTSAKARSKGDSQSQLTIAFDKLNVANGKQLTVKGAVQAVFPPADEVDPGVPGAATAHGSGGSPVQAAAPNTPDYKPMSDVKTGVAPGSGRVEPAMDPKSVGVQGMDNLQLEDGVIISKGKNVKLGGGVRMIVHVDIYQ